MSNQIKNIFRYLIYFLLGGFFIWLSLKDLTKEHLQRMGEAFSQARYWIILPVVAILFLSHICRALRWRLLIQALGYKPKALNTIFSVLIGYLINQAVPRLGEIMKCTTLGRYEKIPTEELVGTIILERIFDTFCLLIVFGITIAIQPDLYSEIIDTFFSGEDGPKQHGKTLGQIVFALLIVGTLVYTAIWFFVKKKTPHDIWEMIKSVIKRMVAGFTTVRHLKNFPLFIFFTIIMWTCYLMGGYLGFKAFRETEEFGIKPAFSILSAGSVGMIASPGGIGAYPLILQKTMSLYDLDDDIGTGFGWIVWCATTAVVIVGGLISLILMPLYNRKQSSNTT